MRKILTRAFITLFMLGGCQSERAEPNPGPRPSESVAPVAPTPSTPIAAAAATNEQNGTPAELNVAGLGSCQASNEVSRLMSQFVNLADADGNGKISRDEAQSASNFVIGGLFFRADQNADGRVTPEEGRKVRNQVTSSHPALASFLSGVRDATGQSPFKSLADALDINYGETLTIQQARKTADEALDGLFRVADGNHDGELTRQEAIGASWNGMRAVGQAVFTSADTNNDKRLSQQEFQAALDGAAANVFKLADANHDGQLSQDEAAVAIDNAAQRLGVSMPQKSGS